MPRKPSVKKESIFEVLCNSKDAIIQNGKIVTPSNTVWSEMSQQLQQKMSTKSLYTFVKLNRHNIWSALEFSNQDNDGESSADPDLDAGGISTRKKDYQEFQLEIPFEEWIQFIPEKVEYKDTFSPSGKMEYTVLKPEIWFHFINAQIWKLIKHTCTFVFQRAEVYPTVCNNYIDMKGYCEECNGHIKLLCDREPTINAPMVFQCCIKNRDVSMHTGCSKRFLSGGLRKQVAKELCEGMMEPAVWGSAKAEELMDVGDPEPSHLPNLATLRTVKEERTDMELGDQDPVVSLQMLKYSAPHSGSIRDIGLDTFFCHYWSQSQLQVYNTLSKKSPSTVCFDATGSVVRQLVRPNGTSGHIFLYQGVLTTHNCSSVPVVQMLSERHDVNAIAIWLTEWICAGATVPNEVVSGFSLAILGALVKAFTPHPDLKSYINECFNVLLGNKSAKLPPCFIKIDVAHCMRMICQWDCLRKKPHCVKDFFVRSIAQLLQSQCLDRAKKLLHAITVVALSEAEGQDSSGNPLESEVCKSYLKAQIAEDSIILDEESEDIKTEDPCEEIQTDVRQWVTEICEESWSLAAADGDRDNIHFLPEIIPYIIRLASYLPLWTGIMDPLFHSTSITASSAIVEAQFTNVKRGLFKHGDLPVNVDRFIAHHLSFIEENIDVSSI